MEWLVETDVDAYADRVLPWLGRDPVRNTVPSTVLITRRDGTIAAADLWLAWLADDTGAVAGMALRTPPRGLLLPLLPAGAAAELAAGVAEPALPAAAGPTGEVADFVAAYTARTGAAARVHQSHRLFELPELIPPPTTPGALRVTRNADAGLCARWFADFAVEAGTPTGPDPAATRRVIAQGRLLFWEVGGAPVGMVGHSPTVGGVTRIGPVWTPPEHRRHGYAAAATAELAARLRERGEVVLFADRANRTSTGVYERIGFRPVGDWEEWRLEY